MQFLATRIAFVELYCLYHSNRASKKSTTFSFSKLSACVNCKVMVSGDHRALKIYLAEKANEG